MVVPPARTGKCRPARRSLSSWFSSLPRRGPRLLLTHVGEKSGETDSLCGSTGSDTGAVVTGPCRISTFSGPLLFFSRSKDAPLNIDPDAVLRLPNAARGLQPTARTWRQVLQAGQGFKNAKTLFGLTAFSRLDWGSAERLKRLVYSLKAIVWTWIRPSSSAMHKTRRAP